MNAREKSVGLIGAKSTTGAIWIGARMITMLAINFVTMAVLARLLDLYTFGLIAIANTAMNFFGSIASNGANQFIVFDHEDNFQNRAKAAFWLNLLFGILAVIIGFLIAEPASQFFDEPEFQHVFQIMILRFPLEAMTRIYDAISHKKLLFRNIQIRDTLIQLVAGAISISMAFAGYGVWSLVLPLVILSPFQLFFAVIGSEWRPGWKLGIPHWPRILNYTKSIVGSIVNTFILSHGDTILVGKMLGTALLGVYNLSWQISNLVSKTIVNGGNQLFFPMLAAVGENKNQLHTMLINLLQILSAITFPLLICLFVLADDVIYTIYGDRWGEAVIPLKILIIYAIRYSIGSPLGAILKVLGRPDLIFKLTFYAIPVYLGGVWVGCNYGITGVAIGVTFTRTMVGLISFIIVAKQLEVTTGSLIKPLKSGFFAAFTMGLGLHFIKLNLAGLFELGSPIRLSLLIGAGFLIYFIVIRFIFCSVALIHADLASRVCGQKAGLLRKILLKKNSGLV